MLKQLIGIVAAVALGIGGAWLAVNYTQKPQEAGVLGEQNLPEGGDFTLQSVDGDVHLSDFRGSSPIGAGITKMRKTCWQRKNKQRSS